MKITKLEEMFAALQGREKKRLVAAWAVDNHTISAVAKAVELGIVEAILVGDRTLIEAVCQDENISLSTMEVVHESEPLKAANRAVQLIHEGKGNLLMKGLVSTDQYMRAILNKEFGLLPPKATLSHVSVIENKAYHKLMIVGDVAIIPYPDLKQKVAITNYVIQTAKALGIEIPKVAIIAATEQVSPGMQACIDASIISKMGDRGQIKGAVIDGPLALDIAICKESAATKNITGDVAGDADCLVFPNIDAGNVFYKANTKLCNADLGAIVMGAKVPCILSSRGDSTNVKLYSIALASLVAK